MREVLVKNGPPPGVICIAFLNQSQLGLLEPPFVGYNVGLLDGPT